MQDNNLQVDNHLRPQCLYLKYSNQKKSSTKSTKYRNKFQSKVKIIKLENIIKGFTPEWEKQLSEAAAKLLMNDKLPRDWYWGDL